MRGLHTDLKPKHQLSSMHKHTQACHVAKSALWAACGRKIALLLLLHVLNTSGYLCLLGLEVAWT
jgi:hypothetical protein